MNSPLAQMIKAHGAFTIREATLFWCYLAVDTKETY
jgi:hypothetical protein